MEILGGVLVLVLIGAFLGGAILVMRRLERRRLEGMRSAATSLGLTFEAASDPALLDKLGSLPLFQGGFRKRVSHVLRGTNRGIDFKLFDYGYATALGSDSRVVEQTVVWFRSSSIRLPAFTLRPEKLIHKIGQVFGHQDIDFDSHPTFSNAYLLRGDSETDIRRLFPSHVLDYFERNVGLSVDADEGDLLVYRSDQKLKPTELQGLIETGSAVYDLFVTGNDDPKGER